MSNGLRSPVYRPASNGQIERYVQTMENSLKKLERFADEEVVMVRDYRSPKQRWVVGKVVRACGLQLRIVRINGMFWKRHVDQLRRCKLDYEEATESETPVILFPGPSRQAHNTAPEISSTIQGGNESEVDHSDDDLFDANVAEETIKPPSVNVQVGEATAVEPRRSARTTRRKERHHRGLDIEYHIVIIL
ncbi:uncharacterized protein LOC108864053 [Galendromus occidentalis]|uniref:Uncharacterized protein LOC108864053 n=1 Tax=Galendromus occidentalis TaxID=34638 RepID=A0AAJ7P9D0_9ACAR|nr:uncharacterized protein LOC108864053 [Galendromus occidentalis]